VPRLLNLRRMAAHRFAGPAVRMYSLAVNKELGIHGRAEANLSDSSQR
jgi:hypothetical protein